MRRAGSNYLPPLWSGNVHLVKGGFADHGITDTDHRFNLPSSRLPDRQKRVPVGQGQHLGVLVEVEDPVNIRQPAKIDRRLAREAQVHHGSGTRGKRGSERDPDGGMILQEDLRADGLIVHSDVRDGQFAAVNSGRVGVRPEDNFGQRDPGQVCESDLGLPGVGPLRGPKIQAQVVAGSDIQGFPGGHLVGAHGCGLGLRSARREHFRQGSGRRGECRCRLGD